MFEWFLMRTVITGTAGLLYGEYCNWRASKWRSS